MERNVLLRVRSRDESVADRCDAGQPEAVAVVGRVEVDGFLRRVVDEAIDDDARRAGREQRVPGDMCAKSAFANATRFELSITMAPFEWVPFWWLAWSKMQGLCDEGAHNAAWEELDFEERYRRHLDADEDGREALADLRERIERGEDLALVCFENTDEKRCHRTALRDRL